MTLHPSTLSPQALCTLAMETLAATQGLNILLAPIHALTPLADFMIICSGSSPRHIHALTEHLVIAAKQQAHSPIRTESHPASDWRLVDLGSLIVHIMLPDTRQLYRLEELWVTSEENLH